MSKLRSFVEFLKVFWQMSRSDWHEMDRKLVRIAVGIVTFVVWAFFWFYFFKSSTPFG